MASPNTDASGQIIKKPQNGTADKSLAGLIQKLTPEIARALPKHVNPDRMARVVTTALRTVPKLAECTPASFLGCVIQCAQLGLEPSTPLGHAYLIPFENRKKGVVECQLIIGYKGLIDLARRSGMVSNLYAYAVKDGDRFHYQLGTKRLIDHIPAEDADRESRPTTHVYAVAKIRDGEPEFNVLTRAQVEARRARSRAGKFGPWVTDWEPMALKSAVRALAPWIPQSAEFARAVVIDETSERGSSLPALDDETQKLLLSTGVAERTEFDATAEESETSSERQPGED